MQNYSYNGEVNKYFLTDDGTPERDETKALCLIKPTDSWTTAKIRMETFYYRVLKIHQQTNAYRTPESDNGDIIYRPQITFYFRQDKDAAPEGYKPVDCEISFRLITEMPETYTKAEMLRVANEINLKFGGKPAFKFKKGKIMAYYLDKKHGYDFRIPVMEEAEAERVIRAIFTITNHTFEEDRLRFSHPKRSNTATPKTTTILGKRRKENRWRPNAIVEFQWAELYLHGLKPTEQPVLVDCSGTKRNALKIS
jgi:hypothetical protein